MLWQRNFTPSHKVLMQCLKSTSCTYNASQWRCIFEQAVMKPDCISCIILVNWKAHCLSSAARCCLIFAYAQPFNQADGYKMKWRWARNVTMYNHLFKRPMKRLKLSENTGEARARPQCRKNMSKNKTYCAIHHEIRLGCGKMWRVVWRSMICH